MPQSKGKTGMRHDEVMHAWTMAIHNVHRSGGANSSTHTGEYTTMNACDICPQPGNAGR
jgi:hypothetical protein